MKKSLTEQQMRSMGLPLTPELPGFMRQQQVLSNGNLKPIPQVITYYRWRFVDNISYTHHDSEPTAINACYEKDDMIGSEGSQISIPDIVVASRCLDRKSRFFGMKPVQQCNVQKNQNAEPDDAKRLDDNRIRVYGLESIHYKHLSQSVNDLRRILLQKRRHKKPLLPFEA